MMESAPFSTDVKTILETLETASLRVARADSSASSEARAAALSPARPFG